MDNSIITIQELLEKRGLDSSKKIKLVRHKDNDFDVYSAYKDDDQSEFLYYNANQSKPVFSECEYIVVFLGETGAYARFLEVYKVNGVKTISDSNKRPANPKGNLNSYSYDLTPVEGFESLKERVIIDWGKSAISWNQWYSKNPKEVVMIEPSLDYERFVDYESVLLDWDSLTTIIEDKENHRTWHDKLSSVNGIYLILDKSNGKQYVGSAYNQKGNSSNAKGILGRWIEYIKSEGTGNNLGLEKEKQARPDFHKNLQWSILMTLPLGMEESKIIAYEQRFKEKLGTRNYGYNEN